MEAEATRYKVEAWDVEGRLIRHAGCVRRRDAFRMVEGLLSEGFEARAVLTHCDGLRRRACTRRVGGSLHCPV